MLALIPVLAQTPPAATHPIENPASAERSTPHRYPAGLNERRPEETGASAEDLRQACLTADAQRQLAAKFVDEKLALWRQRLKLEEWRISVIMIRRSDLKPRTLGGIRWDKRKRSAVLSVLDPSEYRLPYRQMLDDMEFTIVHELVHLELASLPRSEASRRSEEHAVNRITEALLTLERRK